MGTGKILHPIPMQQIQETSLKQLIGKFETLKNTD